MEDVPRFAAGALIDARYEIRRDLGRGERSRVFEALDRESGATVALKLIAPPRASRRVVSARLLGELQRLLGFEHPHAVRVLRGFEWEGGVAVAMQLVAGRDLAAHVAAHGPLDCERAARLGGDLSRALAAAHARGLLHRNVKPTNVLLGDDGRAQLGDFGCARIEGQSLLAEVDEPVATVAFLPPEVIAGRTPDARGDLYALGMTLYFALTGRTPQGAGPGLPAAPRGDGHHPRELRADVPIWLDRVVARATAARPHERFATARDLLAALAQRSEHAPAADPDLLDVCVLCRQPGTLGRAICPHCEDTSSGPDDTLLVLERAAGAAERRERAHRLGALSDQHAASPLLAWAASGRLGLVRVSERQARRMAQHLAAHGLATRRVPVDEAWSLLPAAVSGATAALLGLALVAGAAGGGGALHALLLLGGVLPAAATALVQRTTLLPRRGWPRPPAALVREAAAVVPELPAGEARQLLVECLRLGRALDERLARAGACARSRHALADLLLAACSAARELAELDSLLGALQLHGPQRFELPPKLLECQSRVGQARAALIQSLLETTAALSRLRSHDATDESHWTPALRSCAAELVDVRLEAAEQAKHGLGAFAARG